MMEEREELMVSPTGGNPTLRIAHFLKPFTHEPLHNLSTPTANSKKPPLKVTFGGWRQPPQQWKQWVNNMHSQYQSLWKKAGIHDPILNSTYTINRNNHLVLKFAERWCSETKTFVFPWGEASITLEDIMVLGGYSVLGDSVLAPLQRKEVEIVEKLIQARKQVSKSNNGDRARESWWMGKFMDTGDEIEHEAFLALWLSRFVLSLSQDHIGKHVFPMAVRLAKGIKLALAPAVLATIYRDLNFLKLNIVVSNKCHDGLSEIMLWAPLQFVQIWVFERFPTLRPNPNSVKHDEPRWAKWHCLKKEKIDNLSSDIDSASEDFLWRPYVMAANNPSSRRLYREKEEWVIVESGLDEELESLARCFRVSELVGIDCIEQYLPHRVAMQFGMDQDLPGNVIRANQSPEIAWQNYIRLVGAAVLYFPPRLFEADVTTRYLNWWKQSVFAGEESVGKRKRKFKSLTTLIKGQSSHEKRGDDVDDAIPSVHAEKQTLAEIVRKIKGIKIGEPSKVSRPSSSNVENGTDQDTQRLMKTASWSREGNGVDNKIAINDHEGESSSNLHTIQVRGLELEARIIKLEKVVGRLKAAKLDQRFDQKSTNGPFNI